MKNKKLFVNEKILIFLVLSISLLSLVSADSYSLYCLGDGEQVDLRVLCNPAMRVVKGPTTLCMHNLDNGKICPTNINTCNGIAISCSSSGGSGGPEIDKNAPNLTINSPDQNSLYTSRTIFFSLLTNEKADIYFLNNAYPERKWTRLCSNCMSYQRKRALSDGENDLSFKAVDKARNEKIVNVLFFIDSKAPRIKKVLPQKGFASGLFEIDFDEENPVSLSLKIENSSGGTREIAINISANCIKLRSYECSTEQDLSRYNGQIINYWFTLVDKAGNSVSSKKIPINIDSTSPLITSVTHEIERNNAEVTLSVTELNFDGITYINNNDRKPIEKRFCTRLKEGKCEKRIRLNNGENNILFTAHDKAGNTGALAIVLTN